MTAEWQCEALEDHTVLITTPSRFKFHFRDTKSVLESALNVLHDEPIVTLNGDVVEIEKDITELYSRFRCTKADAWINPNFEGKLVVDSDFSATDYLEVVLRFLADLK